MLGFVLDQWLPSAIKSELESLLSKTLRVFFVLVVGNVGNLPKSSSRRGHKRRGT
jgi:hypothetical protein